MSVFTSLREEGSSRKVVPKILHRVRPSKAKVAPDRPLGGSPFDARQAHDVIPKINRSTVRRYLKQLDEEGSLVPKKAPGSRPKLDESTMRLLEEDIKARPGATHKHRSEFLFAACGVEVSETTICRAIKKRLAHSRKKDQREPVRGTSG